MSDATDEQATESQGNPDTTAPSEETIDPTATDTVVAAPDETPVATPAPKPGRKGSAQPLPIPSVVEGNGDGTIPNTVDLDALSDDTAPDVDTKPATDDEGNEIEGLVEYDQGALQRLISLGRQGNADAIEKLGDIAREASKRNKADEDGTVVPIESDDSGE